MHLTIVSYYIIYYHILSYIVSPDLMLSASVLFIRNQNRVNTTHKKISQAICHLLVSVD